MVLLHVTKGPEEFVFDSSSSTPVSELTHEIASIHNLRLRIKRLAGGLRQLAMYGPMKPESERGLSEDQINAMGKEQKEIPGADPLGMRIGKAPDAQVAITMAKVAEEADAVISPSLAKLRKATTRKSLEDALATIKGVVMMAYPMGLPEWDTVRLGIEDKENLEGSEDSKLQLIPSDSVLWFAGKQMEKAEKLAKYSGNNEKVFLKVKLEGKNGSAPSREPAIDAETQKKMMALWHKKEQENKQLEAAEEESYLNSEWANPKGYKNQMLGIGNIKFRPGK